MKLWSNNRESNAVQTFSDTLVDNKVEVQVKLLCVNLDNAEAETLALLTSWQRDSLSRCSSDGSASLPRPLLAVEEEVELLGRKMGGI